MTCFFCDGKGHYKADCEERKKWEAGKKKGAAATSSSGSGGKATSASAYAVFDSDNDFKEGEASNDDDTSVGAFEVC